MPVILEQRSALSAHWDTHASKLTNYINFITWDDMNDRPKVHISSICATDLHVVVSNDINFDYSYLIQFL